MAITFSRTQSVTFPDSTKFLRHLAADDTHLYSVYYTSFGNPRTAKIIKIKKSDGSIVGTPIDNPSNFSDFEGAVVVGDYLWVLMEDNSRTPIHTMMRITKDTFTGFDGAAHNIRLLQSAGRNWQSSASVDSIAHNSKTNEFLVCQRGGSTASFFRFSDSTGILVSTSGVDFPNSFRRLIRGFTEVVDQFYVYIGSGNDVGVLDSAYALVETLNPSQLDVSGVSDFGMAKSGRELVFQDDDSGSGGKYHIFTLPIALTAPLKMPTPTFKISGDPDGANDIIFTLTAPNDGGSAILRYEYDIDGDDVWRTTGSNTLSFMLTDVAAGTKAYRFRAVNSVGPGLPSDAVSITISGVPQPPPVDPVIPPVIPTPIERRGQQLFLDHKGAVGLDLVSRETISTIDTVKKTNFKALLNKSQESDNILDFQGISGFPGLLDISGVTQALVIPYNIITDAEVGDVIFCSSGSVPTAIPNEYYRIDAITGVLFTQEDIHVQAFVCTVFTRS